MSFRSALSRAHGPLGIRLGDVGMTLLVLLAVELDVATGSGPGAAPLNAVAYLLGAILVLPVLLRNRFPRFELIACSVLLLLYYSLDRRDISPVPLLCVPLYDAAVAGFLVAAIIIPTFYMTVGLFVVGLSTHQGIVSLADSFLPGIVVLFLAIALGDVVRSRRALAAETAERLRVAHEEREAEAGRRVAEERLRIARDLHDTVAHSMATITVQAGSALHVLGPGDDKLRGALLAIRETSKDVLREMRATLGQLRQGTPDGDGQVAAGGLDRLPALRDAVDRGGGPGDDRGGRRAAPAATAGGRGGVPHPARVTDQRAAARGPERHRHGQAVLRARRPRHQGHRRRRGGAGREWAGARADRDGRAGGLRGRRGNGGAARRGRVRGQREAAACRGGRG